MRTPGTAIDLDEYLRVHIDSAGIDLAVLLIEYGLGIDLSAEMTPGSDVRSVADAGTLYGLLCNDLFSYRKEIFNEDASMNPIGVLMHSEGLTIQETVDRLCELIIATEARFYDLRAEILAGELGDRQDVRVFIDGIEHMMAGNLHWCLISPRFHGPGHQRNGTTHGDNTAPRPDRLHPCFPGEVSMGFRTSTRARCCTRFAVLAQVPSSSASKPRREWWWP